MRRLTYENPKGEEIVFYLSPFLIESLEGIGEVESDVQTKSAPYADGVTHIDSRLEPRHIDMEGSIMLTGFKDIREKRRVITRVCNPKLGLGLITFELDGETYQIRGVPDAVPTFPERGRNPWQPFEITWLCPNPYWRSPNETAKPLVAYVGHFKLPTKFPFKLGTSGSKTTLYNDGDVPAPVRIEMHGPTTNPQIFNRTTGEYLRINRTIARGEVMHINTESGKQRVVIIDEEGNEDSAFGYLDHDSDLFYLQLGENVIEHVADAGNRHAEVIVRWDSMFVGV